MPPYKINKEQSLKQLRDFCSRNKVYGWCSNMWYHGLKNAYPLEFLLYTQYSTTHPNSRIFAKNRFSDKVNLKIQKLLEFSLVQEDVDYLNSIMSQLDDRISQKEKQLKN
jgi:hypothetical protein